MTGTVYFVSAPERIKIGWTGNPDSRLAKLRQVDMEELEVIGTVKGSRKLERLLHDMTRDYHVRGEWFRDTDFVRSVIDQALRGEIDDPESQAAVNAAEPPPPSINLAERSNALFSILNASVEELKRVMEEEIKSAEAGERRDEYRKQIKFLTEKILMPIHKALDL